jgi:hypothetical protein
LGSPTTYGERRSLRRADLLCLSRVRSIHFLKCYHMSDEELRAEIERLRQENAALKSKTPKGGVYFKVSEKGGLSVYGLGRFPVTLYQEQWLKLLDMSDEIRAFIKEHALELKLKGTEDKSQLQLPKK